jgi:antitoxin (DNA-binding transcriptional repressor) of toxin-antitoxin stability system
MPSVNLRELRNTAQLISWLEAGQVVELRKRNRVIAHIVPESPRREDVKLPDFATRRKRIFGDRVIPIVDDMIAERNSRY